MDLPSLKEIHFGATKVHNFRSFNKAKLVSLKKIRFGYEIRK